VAPSLPAVFLLLFGAFSTDLMVCPDEIRLGEKALPSTLAPLQGYWQDKADPDYLLAVEGTRIIVAFGAQVREVVSILGSDGQDARICHSGREAQTALRYQEGELIFRDPFREQAHRLTRLTHKPAGLCLSPIHLPGARPLSASRIEQIQRELYERSLKEQSLLRPSNPPQQGNPPWLQTQSTVLPMPGMQDAGFKLADQVMKNTEYVRGVLMEVGWIDVERFGHGASNAAFLIVQHSWDVPLMLAVLPRLKKDVDAGLMGSDAYALLYDRLQLALGLPQRYGTQIGRDTHGYAIVLPVEAPARVEELRRQRGLIPLTDYVKVFGASEVRFSSACQSQPR
jgi:hypothetical protein